MTYLPISELFHTIIILCKAIQLDCAELPGIHWTYVEQLDLDGWFGYDVVLERYDYCIVAHNPFNEPPDEPTDRCFTVDYLMLLVTQALLEDDRD